MPIDPRWHPRRLTAPDPSPLRFAAVVWLVYAVATAYVAVHHEPWRDEADPWLVARDASIPELFEWTRYVGSPALWYLLLKPLIWLKLPYASQEALHVFIAWISVAMLLLRSPFTRLTRVLLVSSYYLFYEFAVIARSYALTILVLFVIASWYPQRVTRPIRYAIAIALLFNTNVHGALAAGILAFFFALEKPRGKPWWIAIGTMTAGAVAAWAQLLPGPHAAFPHVVRPANVHALFTSLAGMVRPGSKSGFVLAVALLLIALIAMVLRRHREVLFFFGLTILALEILYVFVWFGGERHAGVLLVIAIVALWLAGDIPDTGVARNTALVLNCALAASLPLTFATARSEVTMSFSGSKEIALFIREHGLEHYPVAAHNIHQCEPLLPYLPGKQFWYIGVNRYGTYMRWDREEWAGSSLEYPAAVARAIHTFGHPGRKWLLLLNKEMPDPGAYGFRLLYSNRRPVFRNLDERYWLYEWIGR